MSCYKCKTPFIDNESIILMITDMPTFLAGGCSVIKKDGKFVVDPTTYEPPAFEYSFIAIYKTELLGCITDKYSKRVFGGDESPVCDVMMCIACREDSKKDEITLANGDTFLML